MRRYLLLVLAVLAPPSWVLCDEVESEKTDTTLKRVILHMFYDCALTLGQGILRGNMTVFHFCPFSVVILFNFLFYDLYLSLYIQIHTEICICMYKDK